VCQFVSMEGMGAEVSEASDNSATRELTIEQTKMEKIQQDSAIKSPCNSASRALSCALK